tara:strand:+ start:570 stop:1178 length:609 start_codon:yes stop_codon:yes gene_type:complete
MINADNRAKLQLKPGAVGTYLTGNPLLAPLQPHRGIMFPYQPDITFSQSVNYSPYDMAHTNYTFNAYRNTPSPSIQMNAQFASVTEEEGRYTLACIHFLRSISKMFFGIKDLGNSPSSGTPPPVLVFSAFGEHSFNLVPVVIESFSTNYDSQTDLKDVDGTNIPVIMNMFIGLSIQQNPDRQKNVYSTHSFINGSMYKEGFI